MNAKAAEPLSFNVIISKQASQVIVTPCKHLELHMARNVFPGAISRLDLNSGCRRIRSESYVHSIPEGLECSYVLYIRTYRLQAPTIYEVQYTVDIPTCHVTGSTILVFRTADT